MDTNSVFEITPVKEFLLSLPHEERTLFKQYAADIPQGASVAYLLMIAGANLIPHGYYSLAEKSLLKGMELAGEAEKARLHLNLAQLYVDWYEQTIDDTYLDACRFHCQSCLTLGFFTDFIKANFSYILDGTVQ